VIALVEFLRHSRVSTIVSVTVVADQVPTGTLEEYRLMLIPDDCYNGTGTNRFPMGDWSKRRRSMGHPHLEGLHQAPW
jgi:hypothetical protein